MRKHSHSFISEIRDAVQIWRRRNGWSRETVCQLIVENFNSQQGPDIIGLNFDPPTKDLVERQKINAERIFRWLDDETKDNNLLSANFVPFIISALPLDLRIDLLDRVLQPAHLAVRVLNHSDPHCLALCLQAMAKESGEAVAAMAALQVTDAPESLQEARKQITEALAALNQGLAAIESRIGN